MLAPPIDNLEANCAPELESAAPVACAPRAARALHVRILAGSLTPQAGSHIYNSELIRRLAARGHRVSVVALDDGGDRWSPIEVTVLPKHSWKTMPVLWRFAGPLQGLLASRQIAAARLDRPDVVIAAEHFFLKPHARRFRRVPWLYLPHSLVIGREIDSYGMSGLQAQITQKYYVRQQRWALKHASGIVRFNRIAADALRNHYAAAVRAPMLINPPGVDIPASLPPRGERAAGPLRMLFVGRLVPSKNVDFLVQSLGPHRDASWTLDVVGEGPERTQCEAQARKLGISDRVRFHGHQTDIGPWYRAADLFVFPSRLESMGLAVLEAMSHGVPPLVIQADGDRYRVPFAEVVTDRANGLLARDEKDFQRRLCEAIAHPEQTGALSNSARRHVAMLYNWNRHLSAFESAFEQLLTPRS